MVAYRHLKSLSCLKCSHCATRGTLEMMGEKGVLNGKFPYHEVSDNGDEVLGMLIKSFETPHDTDDSCGFTIDMPDERRVGICTDLGHLPDGIFSILATCDLVMLESNHDVGMLQNGAYPYPLKRRILSKFGHLSNDSCAQVTAKLVQGKTSRLYLAHLSAENNMPQLAYQANLCEIQKTGAVLGTDYLMKVNQKESTDGLIIF